MGEEYYRNAASDNYNLTNSTFSAYRSHNTSFVRMEFYSWLVKVCWDCGKMEKGSVDLSADKMVSAERNSEELLYFLRKMDGPDTDTTKVSWGGYGDHLGREGGKDPHDEAHRGEGHRGRRGDQRDGVILSRFFGRDKAWLILLLSMMSWICVLMFALLRTKFFKTQIIIGRL